MLNLNFTTLTPLHISNGENLGAGLDYILLKESKDTPRRLCKINFNRLSEKLVGKFDFKKNYDLKNFTEIIKKTITELFQNNKLDNSYFFYKVVSEENFLKFYDNEQSIGQKFVLEFINSNGKFYIPASSVKGALLTVLGLNHLGINHNNPNIKHKFVFLDSDEISPDNFMVYRTNSRPPAINLICLKPNFSFTMSVRKKGNLDLNKLKNNLKTYSETQIKNALKELKPYKSKTGEPKGADIFEEALKNINFSKLYNDEYLINLGFGGGSWFKIMKGRIPKFPSRRRRRGVRNNNQDREAAHTSVSFGENPIHIGWCKLKIEEL